MLTRFRVQAATLPFWFPEPSKKPRDQSALGERPHPPAKQAGRMHESTGRLVTMQNITNALRVKMTACNHTMDKVQLVQLRFLVVAKWVVLWPRPET